MNTYKLRYVCLSYKLTSSQCQAKPSYASVPCASLDIFDVLCEVK